MVAICEKVVAVGWKKVAIGQNMSAFEQNIQISEENWWKIVAVGRKMVGDGWKMVANGQKLLHLERKIVTSWWLKRTEITNYQMKIRYSFKSEEKMNIQRLFYKSTLRSDKGE